MVAAEAANCDVVLWARSAAVCEEINKTRKNPKRFSNLSLPPSVTANPDFASAVAGAAAVILAIPAQHAPECIEAHRHLLPTGIPLVSTAKGIHVKSHRLMSEALPHALGDKKNDIALVYLSGPSFAKEMMHRHPMAVVVASEKLEDAEKVQGLLSCSWFRIYCTDDVVGAEVGGALKNPLAIGAGIAIGLGYGQSTLAAMVTRGCREMRMLTVALGGRPETLVGLSGFGDLMLTCFSSQSRNNRFGTAIATGMSVEEACASLGEVVEGLPTAKEVARLAKKHDLTLPIFFGVAAILNGETTAAEVLETIMGRQPGIETFH